MKRAITALIGLALLSGCATQYQPFQAFGTGGYAETPLGPDAYKVAYYGNHLTSMSTLSTLLLYRCAELTTQKGFSSFQITKGYGSQPMSALGGFRTLEYRIQMRQDTAESPAQQIYLARDVMQRFGPSIGK